MCICIVCVYVCIHAMRVVRLPHKLTYCFFPFSWGPNPFGGGGPRNRIPGSYIGKLCHGITCFPQGMCDEPGEPAAAADFLEGARLKEAAVSEEVGVWAPGKNVGSWISAFRPVTQQLSSLSIECFAGLSVLG